MIARVWLVAAVLAVSLVWPGRGVAQTASPESLAAARELIVEAKVADQIKLAMPLMLQQLKPLIARGNPLVEKDFDALVPVVMAAMSNHLDRFLDAATQIYAKHFTADEMKQVLAFYRTPTGQKLLQQLPQVMQETMVLGQKFGVAMGEDIQKAMTEELRKRGHNI